MLKVTPIERIIKQSLYRSRVMKSVAVRGKRAVRGERLTKGPVWRLITVKGKKRVFAGTLIETINAGSVRLAVFSVPKEMNDEAA